MKNTFRKGMGNLCRQQELLGYLDTPEAGLACLPPLFKRHG